MRTFRLIVSSLSALALLALVSPSLAHGGCGCVKPPPPPAPVRPGVAYAGTPITLFSTAFKVGLPYTVTFTSGTAAASVAVPTVAVARRDLADGLVKTQVVVPLPSLPLGPTRIVVSSLTTTVVSVADRDFTVAPQPVGIPADYGRSEWPRYAAAVGRDGTTYISLDVSSIRQPMVFDAQALGFALRFRTDKVAFYNPQGFLMQRLVQAGTTQPIPGMFVLPASGTSASDKLHYSRHEFTTYFLQHAERQPHAVDLRDPNWHLDGSRHIDHDHLILAIDGTANGADPIPGNTPAFTLRVDTYSLFHNGLVGDTGVSLTGAASTDSFERRTFALGANGDVFTNGTLTVASGAMVRGDATAASFNVASSDSITGERCRLSAPTTFMPVQLPPMLPSLGRISLAAGKTKVIYGPGSFSVTDLYVNKDSRLFIDNTAGPVTLYVTGQMNIAKGATVDVADPNPEHFAVYMTSSQTAFLGAGKSSFFGVVYAPQSALSISGSGEFFGAFVGRSVSATGGSRIHYDGILKGEAN